jgi:hypothetical protein
VSGAPPTRDAPRTLARALDDDDFAGAANVLDPGCSYQSPEGLITGPDAIVASYRAHSERARATFDEVVYESEIGDVSDGEIPIVYIDRIRQGRARHVHRCRQWVHVAASGRIDSIRHEELHGEREALNRFVESLR